MAPIDTKISSSKYSFGERMMWLFLSKDKTHTSKVSDISYTSCTTEHAGALEVASCGLWKTRAMLWRLPHNAHVRGSEQSYKKKFILSVCCYIFFVDFAILDPGSEI